MERVEGKIIESSNGTYPEYKDGQPTGQQLPYVHLVLVNKNANAIAVASGMVQRYNLNILFPSVESYEEVKELCEPGKLLPFFKEVVKVAPFGRVWGPGTQRAGEIITDANGNPISYDELLVITIKEDVNAASEAMRIRNRGIKQGTMYEFTPSQAHQEDPATADNNVFMGGGQGPQQTGSPVGGQQPRPQFLGNGRQH